MTGKETAAKVRDTQEVADIINGDTSKSSKIRTLHGMGYDRSAISNLLGIRYQHVRNVLLTQLTSK